jgi:hypothetical protein
LQHAHTLRSCLQAMLVWPNALGQLMEGSGALAAFRAIHAPPANKTQLDLMTAVAATLPRPWQERFVRKFAALKGRTGQARAFAERQGLLHMLDEADRAKVRFCRVAVDVFALPCADTGARRVRLRSATGSCTCAAKQTALRRGRHFSVRANSHHAAGGNDR